MFSVSLNRLSGPGHATHLLERFAWPRPRRPYMTYAPWSCHVQAINEWAIHCTQAPPRYKSILVQIIIYKYIYMYTCMCVCIYVTAPRYLRGPSSCTGRISSSCTGQGHSSCTRRTLFLAQEEDPLWHKKEYKHVYNGFVTVNLNWLCVQQWTFVISPGHFSSCLFLVKYRPMA
jgi:hypothetical protein